MHKLLADNLRKKYPKIFPETYNQGFPERGWYFLLDNLCQQIQNHIDEPPYTEEKSLRNFFVKLWSKSRVWNYIIYPLVRHLPTEKYNKCRKIFCPLINHVPSPVRQVVALQVKEKFGSLRFYCGGGDETTNNMIQFACSLSGHICETCGRMNEKVARGSTETGWIKTTCSICLKKRTKSDNNLTDYVRMWNYFEKNQDFDLLEIFRKINKK